jgi:lambda repressor-like predicted transcriptional regulator
MSKDCRLKTELIDFLLEQCKERGLSVRRLSLNSSLSPATVHNIIQRKYKPSIYSLNRLADYLGVDREFLWKLAGLTEGESKPLEIILDDPKVRLHMARVSKLPKEVRNKLFIICDILLTLVETKD